MREGRPFTRRIYIASADKTVQMGSGRKEFNPKDRDWMENERPHLEELIKNAGVSVLRQLDTKYSDDSSGIAKLIESGHLGNFMMPLYCRNQGHRPGLIASIHPDLEGISTIGYEGACASGGLALGGAIKEILAGQSDVSLVIGVEEMTSVHPVEGSKFLAGADFIRCRQEEELVHFFPRVMSNRVDAYNVQFCNPGLLRAAMTGWVITMHHNGGLDPKSQIFKHGMSDEQIRDAAAVFDPDKFTQHLSYIDCSKVTDAGAGLILVSDSGLEMLGSRGYELPEAGIVEIVGYGQAGRDITAPPREHYKLQTTENAVKKALQSAGIKIEKIGLVEVHDCFSNIGVMMLEAAGFVEYSCGPQFVLDGKITRNGELPVNTFGGLFSGHPVGETGVRQAVDIYHQLTGKAGANQVIIGPNRPYALSINMGGNDVTAVAVVYKRVS